MGQIHIRVGDQVQADWNQLCDDIGSTSSEEIRAYIESRLANHQAPSVPRVQRSKQKKARQTVFLTEGEIEGIRLRQTLNGGSRASWIVKFVRAGLTRQPVFDRDEVDALLTSNAALAQIGNNLNQIAKQLNQGTALADIPECLDIAAVKRAMDKHREHVNALVNINLQRWDLSA